MGFYVRKSIKAGPFKYNLNKHGVGVSVGVPGFRIGSGPRGNYIRAGKGGVYYRATLSPHRGPVPFIDTQPGPPVGVSDSVPMEDITGASAAELSPTGPGDLVTQLNEASHRIPLAWPTLAAVLVLALLVRGVGAIVVLVLGLPLVAWLYMRDGARRSVVAFYDVEGEHERWFTELVAAFAQATSMGHAWRINASGHVQSTHQYKVNAGASEIVRRVDVSRALGGPKVLATNIHVPSLTAGKHALHFLPDRLLVREGRRFSDVAYSTLSVRCQPGRFVETGRLPRDAKQVDTTWKYVNVRGGPDRRFKDNKQIPVMLYGEMDLSAPSGLHWLVQCSNVPVAEHLSRALIAAPASEPEPVAPAEGG